MNAIDRVQRLLKLNEQQIAIKSDKWVHRFVTVARSICQQVVTFSIAVGGPLPHPSSTTYSRFIQ